jgi:hypothetical protein
MKSAARDRIEMPVDRVAEEAVAIAEQVERLRPIDLSAARTPS